MRGYTAVPTSATDLITGDAHVYQISIVNNSGGTGTVTIWNKDTVPLILIPPGSLTNNTVFVVVYPIGSLYTGGIRWQASGSGFSAEIVGNKSSTT